MKLKKIKNGHCLEIGNFLETPLIINGVDPIFEDNDINDMEIDKFFHHVNSGRGDQKELLVLYTVF